MNLHRITVPCICQVVIILVCGVVSIPPSALRPLIGNTNRYRQSAEITTSTTDLAEQSKTVPSQKDGYINRGSASSGEKLQN